MQDFYHQPYIKAFGPKDHTIQGLWASLIPRDKVYEFGVAVAFSSRKNKRRRRSTSSSSSSRRKSQVVTVSSEQ